MRRTEWLIQLEQELTRLGVVGRKEIIEDYEEHFAVATDAGKSEEEVAEKLGDPRAAAKAHMAEGLVTQATRPDGKPADMATILKATFRLLVLTPFTFLMLIGPFAIVAAMLLAGWGVSVAFGGVSLGAIAVGMFSFPFLLVNVWGAGAFFFGALACIGATAVWAMTMFVITKWTLQVFVSYLRWNVNFVLEK